MVEWKNGYLGIVFFVLLLIIPSIESAEGKASERDFGVVRIQKIIAFVWEIIRSGTLLWKAKAEPFSGQ